MHFLGGVRKGIVVVVALLFIASNVCLVSIEASAAEGALTEEQEVFVAKFYAMCIENAADYKLAWQTPMAQAIVESKSGTSNLAEKYHNFHGITSKKGGYKHFSTDEDGWIGYFENLENTPVYDKNGIFETGEDPYRMLDVLVESGYAEDESYAKVIGIYIKLIEKWRVSNELPTSSEYAEKEQQEQLEHQENEAAVKDLTPAGGCAGFSQMIREIPTEKPTSTIGFEEDNETNDPKHGEGAAECRSFSCQTTYAIIPLWKFC